jgi:hypothetical protein
VLRIAKAPFNACFKGEIRRIESRHPFIFKVKNLFECLLRPERQKIAANEFFALVRKNDHSVLPHPYTCAKYWHGKREVET